MKKLSILILALLLACCTVCMATAETKTVTLGNDTVANTTPFGNVSVNQQYQLYKGMVLTVIGEYDGWMVVKYNNEFGTLFIETGSHSSTNAQIPTAPASKNYDNITYGVVGEKWQVWARYEPKSVFEEGEEKGDRILHAGDKVEINGEIVTDEQGNEYYPIRIESMTENGYVQRYVTAKYIDVLID